MTWDWLSFLAGAPIWGSIGAVLFAALVTARSGDEVVTPERLRRTAHRHAPVEGPTVISLGEYRAGRESPTVTPAAHLPPPPQSSEAPSVHL